MSAVSVWTVPAPRVVAPAARRSARTTPACRSTPWMRRLVPSTSILDRTSFSTPCQGRGRRSTHRGRGGHQRARLRPASQLPALKDAPARRRLCSGGPPRCWCGGQGRRATPQRVSDQAPGVAAVARGTRHTRCYPRPCTRTRSGRPCRRGCRWWTTGRTRCQWTTSCRLARRPRVLREEAAGGVCRGAGGPREWGGIDECLTWCQTADTAPLRSEYRHA